MPAQPNPFCAGLAPKENETGENPQSAGIVVEYGKFRFGDFGDLTWNKELELLCPENRVGKTQPVPDVASRRRDIEGDLRAWRREWPS